MAWSTVYLFTSIVLCISLVSGYMHFQDRIPNGHRVPHPCQEGVTWYGVGHMNRRGGGSRNAFGYDFAKSGFNWTECLCRTDSDGDGRTNGEELGDPDCIWTAGSDAIRIYNITHPGICEPISSATCSGKTEGLECSVKEEFDCDVLHEPNTANLTLELTRTQVPGRETTYICESFDLVQLVGPGDYHLVAFTPIINNTQVMHHIVLYGCDDTTDPNTIQYFSSPRTGCGMQAFVCPYMLAVWVLGMPGLCYNENMGFTIGQKGFRYVMMELHWHNPEEADHYHDNSGLTLYYTASKRPYEAGVMLVGPEHLQIPPGFEEYSITGGCSSECTHFMLANQSIYLVSILPHMHYLGIQMKASQYRNGQKIFDFNAAQYLYDDPLYTSFDSPVEVLAGDYLEVTCSFQSMTVTSFTYLGYSTSQEMCFAFFWYYPFKSCSNTGLFCESTEGYGNCGKDNTMHPQIPVEVCNLTDIRIAWNEDKRPIRKACDVTGTVCKPNCSEVSERLRTHPCFTGKARDYVRRWHTDDRTLTAIASCDPSVPRASGGTAYVVDTLTCSSEPVNGSPPVVMTTYLLYTYTALAVLLCSYTLSQ